MVERKKIMNAEEMERWLLKKGAVPVSEEIKKKPWYKGVSKLPSCLKLNEVAEATSHYKTKKSK